MKTTVSQRWINVAVTLSNDPTEQVLCPVFQKEYLDVFDVPFEEDENRLERHMHCKNCGAYNALLMKKNYNN